eukprot:5523073-Prymnesium_polylepis.1
MKRPVVKNDFMLRYKVPTKSDGGYLTRTSDCLEMAPYKEISLDMKEIYENVKQQNDQDQGSHPDCDRDQGFNGRFKTRFNTFFDFYEKPPSSEFYDLKRFDPTHLNYEDPYVTHSSDPIQPKLEVQTYDNGWLDKGNVPNEELQTEGAGNWPPQFTSISGGWSDIPLWQLPAGDTDGCARKDYSAAPDPFRAFNDGVKKARAFTVLGKSAGDGGGGIWRLQRAAFDENKFVINATNRYFEVVVGGTGHIVALDQNVYAFDKLLEEINTKIGALDVWSVWPVTTTFEQVERANSTGTHKDYNKLKFTFKSEIEGVSPDVKIRCFNLKETLDKKSANPAPNPGIPSVLLPEPANVLKLLADKDKQTNLLKSSRVHEILGALPILHVDPSNNVFTVPEGDMKCMKEDDTSTPDTLYLTSFFNVSMFTEDVETMDLFKGEGRAAGTPGVQRRMTGTYDGIPGTTAYNNAENVEHWGRVPWHIEDYNTMNTPYDPAEAKKFGIATADPFKPFNYHELERDKINYKIMIVWDFEQEKYVLKTIDTNEDRDKADPITKAQPFPDVLAKTAQDEARTEYEKPSNNDKWFPSTRQKDWRSLKTSIWDLLNKTDSSETGRKAQAGLRK